MPRNNSRQRRDARYEAALARQRQYLQDYQDGKRKHKPAPIEEFMRRSDLDKQSSQPPPPTEQEQEATNAATDEPEAPEPLARPLARRRRVRKGR